MNVYAGSKRIGVVWRHRLSCSWVVTAGPHGGQGDFCETQSEGQTIIAELGRCEHQLGAWCANDPRRTVCQ